MSQRFSRAERMRLEFDAAFARAPQPTSANVDMLVVSVGGVERAVPLAQVARVAKNPGVVKVPAQAEGFAGVAGLLGSVLPVFSLAALLGVAETAMDWLLVVAGSNTGESLAFGCESLRGYVRVDEKNSTREVIRVGSGTYYVLDLLALRDRIQLVTGGKEKDGR